MGTQTDNEDRDAGTRQHDEVEPRCLFGGPQGRHHVNHVSSHPGTGAGSSRGAGPGSPRNLSAEEADGSSGNEAGMSSDVAVTPGTRKALRLRKRMHHEMRKVVAFLTPSDLDTGELLLPPMTAHVGMQALQAAVPHKPAGGKRQQREHDKEEEAAVDPKDVERQLKAARRQQKQLQRQQEQLQLKAMALQEALQRADTALAQESARRLTLQFRVSGITRELEGPRLELAVLQGAGFIVGATQ